MGVAAAFAYRRQPRVAVCCLGDGATSKGDFYEAVNAAGVMNLPVVFVIVNNQWAISVPRQRQTRAETLAQKAIAAGVPGVQCDGNDIVAVRQTVGQAVERARAGHGASVVECLTYRLADHTTLRVGGPARAWVEATSEAELVAAVQAAVASGQRLSEAVAEVAAAHGVPRRQLYDAALKSRGER